MIGLYSANSQAGVGFTGLLDDYPSASAAYSVRRLSGGYTGSLIEVRRSSDNTTQNIGYDSNGDLDTASLLSFVGAGNGFVRTWYDQSGNSNNAQQTTASNQPQIVSSGSLITKGTASKAAISFNGTSSEIAATSISILTQTYSWVGATNNNSSEQNWYNNGDGLGNFNSSGLNNGGNNRFGARILAGGSVVAGFDDFSDTNYYSLGHYVDTSPDSYAYRDGIEGTQTVGCRGFDTSNLSIASRSGNYYLNGYLPEFIVWSSDRRSDLTAIDTNQSTYFGY